MGAAGQSFEFFAVEYSRNGLAGVGLSPGMSTIIMRDALPANFPPSYEQRWIRASWSFRDVHLPPIGGRVDVALAL